jgi:serine/threonine protein phosphatase PrpC
MWNVAGACVSGSSHKRSCTPCQDAYAIRIIPTPNGETLAIAIADGAGSAAHSDLGAREAVEAALVFIADILPDGEQFDAKTGIAVLDEARSRLFAVASERQLRPRDLACTLLFAIISDNQALFGQLGDGAWVITSGAKLIALTWPNRGRYANEPSS